MTADIGVFVAGKIGGALIGGLLSKRVFEADRIVACTGSEESRRRVAEEYGIRTVPGPAEVCSESRIIVLAVKPKQVPEVVSEMGDVSGKILVSVVAGLTVEQLKSYVPDVKIVRVMPNHCCMVLEGAMGYCDDGTLTDSERDEVAGILGSVGLAVSVSESEMDIVTGIAGSSPAFIYLVIDAMADAGVLNGLKRDAAIRLAAQSVLGAAKMVLETGKHPDILRDEVCSPGGTTIEGVRELEDRGLRAAMIAAVDVTAEKSRRMTRG